jgi:ABC-type sugar transport system permease subunit
MTMRKRIHISYSNRQALNGYLFVLPFIIGFIFFFASPLIQSLVYSFGNITLDPKGFTYDFLGVANYSYILFVDPTIRQLILASITTMLTELPTILVFSLIIALLLNQNFRGRGLARSIYFLPVIVMSGIIIGILKDDVFAGALNTGETDPAFLFPMNGLTDLLSSSGVLPKEIIEAFKNIIGSIFDITWKAGIQILLFLSGLQSISPSYYEAAKVEGSTSWESFWKITFPILSPVLILNVVYTIIDSFTFFRNPVLEMIKYQFTEQEFGYSSAIAWLYFLAVLVIVGIVYSVLSRKAFYMVD